MSNGSELKSAGAKALRAAGFVPLPRLWVKQRDLAQIRIFAHQYQDEVNAIRSAANAEAKKERQKDAAWETKDGNHHSAG